MQADFWVVAKGNKIFCPATGEFSTLKQALPDNEGLYTSKTDASNVLKVWDSATMKDAEVKKLRVSLI